MECTTQIILQNFFTNLQLHTQEVLLMQIFPALSWLIVLENKTFYGVQVQNSTTSGTLSKTWEK